jgi:putative PIN family toxin of toxin-antitoxin system
MSVLKLFLDANIFIAGSASPEGGSAIILQACKKGLFQAVTTELVLVEAERNIRKKLDKKVLGRFHKVIKEVGIEIYPPATTASHYQKIITPKDAHVLAAAIESNCDYLITLDRRHFFTPKILKTDLPVKIIIPKNFIIQHLM